VGETENKVNLEYVYYIQKQLSASERNKVRKAEEKVGGRFRHF
jgi:hypothetical protein